MIRNELELGQTALGPVMPDWEPEIEPWRVAPKTLVERIYEELTFEPVEVATQEQIEQKTNWWNNTIDMLSKVGNTAIDWASATKAPTTQLQFPTIQPLVVKEAGLFGIDMKTLLLVGGLGLAGILIVKTITAQR